MVVSMIVAAGSRAESICWRNVPCDARVGQAQDQMATASSDLPRRAFDHASESGQVRLPRLIRVETVDSEAGSYQALGDCRAQQARAN